MDTYISYKKFSTGATLDIGQERYLNAKDVYSLTFLLLIV